VVPEDLKKIHYFLQSNHVHLVLEAKHKNLKRAYVNEYSSLGRVKDFKRLARESKMTIVLSGVQKRLHLDEAGSWMMRSVEHQLKCKRLLPHHLRAPSF
jgi:hypothetical protein